MRTSRRRAAVTGIRAPALAIVALPLLACADHIGRADLLRQIEAGTPPLILDVRSQGEYDAGHVPGALHVPFYSLIAHIDELPAAPDADAPVVVYCEHGPRAGLARAQLWMADDRPVLFLDGHMTTWRSEGFPVEASPSDSDEP